jgi:predicted Fe-Mo cluster-binding NifX family protein
MEDETNRPNDRPLTVAVPADGQLIADDIGRAPSVVVAKLAEGRVKSVHMDANPLRGDGGFSRYLEEHGVTMVLAGHVGPQMTRRLTQRGIVVSVGHSGSIEKALADLSGKPQTTHTEV